MVIKMRAREKHGRYRERARIGEEDE